MKEYSATTTIRATSGHIWKILTHAQDYPEWDPYCEKIDGIIAAGKRLRAYSKLSPGRAFPVKVTEFVSERSMTWSGGMPLGLFRGERTFTLEPQGDGNVRFTVHEVFSGPLLGLIGRSIPDMTVPFKAFAQGLKERAENTEG